jgi:Lrp/AsnC family leucine-responsive transcriptional regulator
MQASPAVLECHHITGAWNYLVKVRVGTTRDLERFLAETIKGVEGVERTETLIVLSSAKETFTVSLPE